MRRSPLLPSHRRLLALGPGAVVTAVVLAILVAGLPPSPEVAGPRASLGTAVGGGCPGSRAPSPATGTLFLRGNSTPLPSVANVSFSVSYHYTEVEKVGGSQTASCVAATAGGVTGARGSIAADLTVPPDRCLPTACIAYQGPFGPLAYATSGPPAGFFELAPTGGTSPSSIVWDADLYSAALNVTGAEVVSTGAPVKLSASAQNAANGPAAGAVGFHWHVAGLGWSNSSPDGPNITVQGIDSGWPGSVYVTAQSTYGSTTESVTSAVLSLSPVATRVRSATASPAPVDPGVPVVFSIQASGAAGYPYTATVDPGLGAGYASGPCASLRLPNGTANLTCTVPASYPGPGTAFPTVSVTNGYSTAAYSMAALSVHPVEQVTLSLPRFVTYPDLPLTMTVNVTNGTGSAPYGPVCLSVNGAPSLTCIASGASPWRFPVTFPAPGEYQLRVSVVDRFGENVSSSAGVLVVPLLTARANGSSFLTLVANQTTPLSVVVGGGALPISTWWNLSNTQTFLCPGSLDFDGTITCPLKPSAPGATNLTVTLRDALGSVTTVVFRLTVTATPTHAGGPGGWVLSGVGSEVVAAALAALAAGVLLVAWDVRRRRAAQRARSAGVEEPELERMARGREHLLGNADPGSPRRPDELVAGWTGPPVAPAEWAEWIAALVADGSLLPSRAADRRLVYRRAPERPIPPTIQFDPTALPARRDPRDDGLDPDGTAPPDQDGG